MKLIVYHPAYPLFERRLRDALRTPWEVECGAGDEGWLGERIGSADALVALALPPDLKPLAGGLRALLFPGAGVMHSDPAELPEGCALCRVYEHEGPIAEYVMMCILLHVTQAFRYAATFRDGRWDGNGRTGGEPHGEAAGKTVGIVGYGHIGKAVACRADAFGMRVIAIRRHSGAAAFDELLEQSDFIVVACPLDDSTRGMIGARELARMKPDAVLINVARAEICDEQSLFEALRSRVIAGACLDVWYRYPATGSETLHGSALPFHELPNVLATPHMSAWTHAMLDRRMAVMARNLDRLALGQPLENVVFHGSWRPETVEAR